MLRALFGNQNDAVDLNSRKLLFAALLIHTIAPQTIIVLPGFVQGLVEQLGFDDKQAGFIASAEFWGMASAGIAMMYLVSRVNWRHVFLVSLVLLFIGNIGSIFIRDFNAFCAIRFLVGVGAGTGLGLSYAVIGLTSKPDRNFGLAALLVLIYGVAVFAALPAVYANVGMTPLFIFFGLFALSGFPFIRHLPTSGKKRQKVDTQAVNIGRMAKTMALGAMFLYFVAILAVWSYLFRVGVALGVSEQQVGNGLALSQFFGIAGAFTATTVAGRFGRALPLGLGILLGTLSLVFLLSPTSAVIFAFVACLYNYAWSMTHPYLLAAMSSFDKTGKMVVYATSMQFLGMAAGPALAASVVTRESYSNVLFLGITIFMGSLALILPPVLRQARLARQLSV